MIIQNLLKALKVAHADKNEVLARRIEQVLTNFSKNSDNTKDANKGKKAMLTEVVNHILKPGKVKSGQDANAMQKAYIDSLVNMTKQYLEQKDKDLQDFVIFTYNELITKFLDSSNRQSIPFAI